MIREAGLRSLPAARVMMPNCFIEQIAAATSRASFVGVQSRRLAVSTGMRPREEPPTEQIHICQGLQSLPGGRRSSQQLVVDQQLRIGGEAGLDGNVPGIGKAQGIEFGPILASNADRKLAQAAP